MEEIIVIPNLRCYYCQVASDSRYHAFMEERRAAREDDERRERQLAERRERARHAREEERLAAREFTERRERRERRAAQEGWNRDFRYATEQTSVDRERRAAREREDVQMGEAGPLHHPAGRTRELSQVVNNINTMLDDINAIFHANSDNEAPDDIASYVNSSDSDSEPDIPHRARRLSSIAIKYLLSGDPPTEEYHTCSICLEPFGPASGEVATSLPRCHKHPCGNICLTEWLQEHDTCPVCRHDYKREIAIAMDIQAHCSPPDLIPRSRQGL
jgi:Ring finger domain